MIVVSKSKNLFRNVTPSCILLQCYSTEKLSNINYALLLQIDLDYIAKPLTEYKLEMIQKPKHGNIIKSLFEVLNLEKVCNFIIDYTDQHLTI